MISRACGNPVRVTLLKMIVYPDFLENYEIFKDLIQTVGLPYLFYCLFCR